jgi:cell wall-associated NlpC family hydrolase
VKILVLALGLLLTLMVGAPVFGAAAVLAAAVGQAAGATATETPTTAGEIPAEMLAIYEAAATACPGLSWTVLAAVGTVESGNGESTLPGVRSGQNPAGAEGLMQFEPATFEQYDRPVPADGAVPPTPYDPVDAAYAAARLLCANGAATAGRLRTALYAYNHSNAYVDQVMGLAGRLAASLESAPTRGSLGVSGPAGPDGARPPSAMVAVDFALAQLGIPYRWGGELPGRGFDCSGLVQAAWAAAGVHLPRVAQEQFAAGPLLAPETWLHPGDLVFFGPPGGGVTHVGLVVAPSGEMVDAPHAGASVRVEPFPLTVGALWGADIYMGATRPGPQ